VNRFVRLSSHIYSRILVLYPADLRREFGDEMTDVFAQDLAEMWHSRRLVGVLNVWRRALCELTSIAAPAGIATSTVIATTISFFWAVIVTSAVIAPTISFFWAVWALGVWPGLAAAITSLIAVSSCRRRPHRQLLLIAFNRE
jgi:hypothetical protein